MSGTVDVQVIRFSATEAQLAGLLGGKTVPTASASAPTITRKGQGKTARVEAISVTKPAKRKPAVKASADAKHKGRKSEILQWVSNTQPTTIDDLVLTTGKKKQSIAVAIAKLVKDGRVSKSASGQLTTKYVANGAPSPSTMAAAE